MSPALSLLVWSIKEEMAREMAAWSAPGGTPVTVLAPAAAGLAAVLFKAPRSMTLVSVELGSILISSAS